MFSHVLHPIHRGPSYLSHVDPRARIILAVVFAVIVAIARNVPAMLFALAIGLALVAAARISPDDLLRRLMPLEILLGVMALLLCLPAPATNRCGWRRRLP